MEAFSPLPLPRWGLRLVGGRASSTMAPRRHGCHPPFHPRQVVAWVLTLFLITTLYGMDLSLLPWTWRLVVATVAFVLYVVLGWSGGYCTLVDPADEGSQRTETSAVRVTESVGGPDQRFCSFCKAYVHVSSKHCRSCDKCILGFDHHCHWVNSCIGTRTYRAFLVLVLSSWGILLCTCLVVTYILVAYGVGVDRVCEEVRRHITGLVMTILGVQGIVAFVCWGNVTWLLLLHAYLGIRGITTYQLVLERRRKAERQAKKKISLDVLSMDMPIDPQGNMAPRPAWDERQPDVPS